MSRIRLTAWLTVVSLVALPAHAADKPVPYWASIVPSKARMRTGPGRNFPASWLYQRSGLPVRVVATIPNWRKIVDPDGTTGWMQANMLSEQRMAIVNGAVRELRALPSADAQVVWRVQPGVLGALSRCDGEWCLLDVGGRKGYVNKAEVWGVGTEESFR